MARRLLLTARAIATGFVVTLLFRLVVAVPVSAAARRWGSSSWFARWLLVQTLPALLVPLASLVAGWAVARLHRQHRLTAVLSYAAFVLVMAMPRLIDLAVNASREERYVPALLTHVVNIVLVVGAVVAGGTLLHPDPRDASADVTARRLAP